MRRLAVLRRDRLGDAPGSRGAFRTAIALRPDDLESRAALADLLVSSDEDWASRTLGIEAPDLYVMDAVPSGIAALQTKVPSTALGPQVTAGMSVQQLAFLVGRHLTYYRPEHYALVFFPTLAELSSLVLAAMRVVIPAIPALPRPDRGPALDVALGARLGQEARASLARVVARLDARGGTMDLLAWITKLGRRRTGRLRANILRCKITL